MSSAAFWLTGRLAVATTVILFVVGLPLAYWLATTRRRFRGLVEAVVTLPLVLPPTVLGFYLLLWTGPDSWIGSVYGRVTGQTLPFTFAGILLGSVLFNLPFAVRPFASAMQAVDRTLMEASWCLGQSRWKTFWRVVFPLAWPGILTGLVLTFAHTVGEFGVVLMVGGNIPGVTRTLSVAIYDDVQALDYASAGRTSVWLVVGCFALLALVQWISGRRTKR
ncbi:molybdate ABC transporter permease subunit [Roseiconus nitratireducens]|uniref:Molybdenum transport system permease n=1 Tax=Roseiconus nitratireducens TaxID=2605748 RepID=A0A5M6D446_9BACT|nr:molybdate ABC transporter permease subunit [Roseiconus nitratireducens]KAA5541360.1 molybdate ABC transporter permease subunit [Roseiconus nitratireducens]